MISIKTVAIGNDHAGTLYKFKIVRFLESKGYEVLNCGSDTEESMDYPDAIHPVAKAVETKKADFGIILCGSGNGAAMTANKYSNVRAALCWNKELVLLARRHNNANVLSIPAWFVTKQEALDFVETFLNTKFEGGRHQRRVEKIAIKT